MGTWLEIVLVGLAILTGMGVIWSRIILPSRSVSRLTKAVDGLTQNMGIVVARLEAAAETAERVASDLLASQGRADAVQGPEGAAADAASRSGQGE